MQREFAFMFGPKNRLLVAVAAMTLVAATVLAVPEPPVESDSAAQTIRIATASNFGEAMRSIAKEFEARSGCSVSISLASTGSHYAQIVNGAPFDAFFAADAEHPRLLEESGLAQTGTRFTYAIGKLVLWSPVPSYVDSAGDILRSGTFRHLALANPRLAPYGEAAEQVLRAMGLWDRLGDRIVRGENIAQAFQFVKSGNAELGFVALSQVKPAGGRPEGSIWYVPDNLYAPIEQQAVALNARSSVHEFLSFVQSASAKTIIRRHGYDVP